MKECRWNWNRSLSWASESHMRSTETRWVIAFLWAAVMLVTVGAVHATTGSDAGIASGGGTGTVSGIGSVVGIAGAAAIGGVAGVGNVAEVGTAAAAARGLPAHAFYPEYEDDWQWDRGFHRVGNRCADVKLPAHSHLTDVGLGKGWECDPGFNDSGSACVAVRVPQHAYPIYTEVHSLWACERGFERVGNSCMAVKLPAGGYLNATGDGWECKRGYRRTDAWNADSTCIALV